MSRTMLWGSNTSSSSGSKLSFATVVSSFDSCVLLPSVGGFGFGIGFGTLVAREA